MDVEHEAGGRGRQARLEGRLRARLVRGPRARLARRVGRVARQLGADGGRRADRSYLAGSPLRAALAARLQGGTAEAAVIHLAVPEKLQG